MPLRHLGLLPAVVLATIAWSSGRSFGDPAGMDRETSLAVSAGPARGVPVAPSAFMFGETAARAADRSHAVIAQAAPSSPPSAANTPAPAGSFPPAATRGAAPDGPTVLPGSLSGSESAPHRTVPAVSPIPVPKPAGTGAGAPPAPGPTAASHFHLHRPGTDIDGDLLVGNTGSDIFVFRGNVVLHSDPKIDREFSSNTESDDPITVTADEIDSDRFASTYVAKGNVHFVQGARSGHCDLATLNEQTRDLDLLGHADVMEGDHRVRAQKMHYNLGDKRFHAAGDLRIYQPAPTPNPQASGTPAPKRRRRLPL